MKIARKYLKELEKIADSKFLEAMQGRLVRYDAFLFRAADQLRESLFADSTLPVLPGLDRYAEKHGREVAERSLWRKVPRILRACKPLHPVVSSAGIGMLL